MSGDLDEAEKAIKEAERLNASVGQTRFLRGTVAYYRGEYDQAVEQLEQSVTLQPDSVAAQGLLAAAYGWAGHWDKLQQVTEKLQKMRPKTTEDYLFKGLAQAFQSPEQGLRTLNEAIRRQPTSIARMIRAGVLEDFAMDTSDLAPLETAIDDMRTCKQLMPDNPAVLGYSVFTHLIEANLCSALGHPERRALALRQAGMDAEALQPFSMLPVAANTRFWYLREAGDDDRMFQEAERIWQQRQSDAYFSAYNYALALLEHGRATNAASVLENRGAKRNQFENVTRAYCLIDLPDGRQQARDAYAEFNARYPRGDAVIWSKTILLVHGLKDEAMKASRADLQVPDRMPPLNHEFWLAALRFLGHGDDASEADLIKRAGKSKRNECMAQFYIGCLRLAEQKRELARDHFAKAVASGCFYFSEYDWSRVFLKRTEADPTWPRWIAPKPEP